MHPEDKGIFARLDASDEEISQAWSHAISIALRNHKRANVPIATWDDANHRIVLIPPDELSIHSEEPLEAITFKTTD